jgi:hypothetical protein
MSRSLREIARRRHELQALAQGQRLQVVASLRPWQRPLAVVDTSLSLLRTFARHPFWLLLAAGAVVVMPAGRARVYLRRGPGAGAGAPRPGEPLRQVRAERLSGLIAPPGWRQARRCRTASRSPKSAAPGPATHLAVRRPGAALPRPESLVHGLADDVAVLMPGAGGPVAATSRSGFASAPTMPCPRTTLPQDIGTTPLSTPTAAAAANTQRRQP